MENVGDELNEGAETTQEIVINHSIPLHYMGEVDEPHHHPGAAMAIFFVRQEN